MKELLVIEWLKIRRFRTFWVLSGLFIVLLPLWNYEICQGVIRAGGGNKGVNFLSTQYAFPEVWNNLGWWGSIFIMFISILVIIIITQEYSYRTNRQNIMDGWKKLQFYHAKVYLIIVLSFVVTVYFFILGVVFGRVNSGSFTGVFDEFQNTAYFFLLTLDYLGFALLIGLFIKKTGLAIGLFILYSLIIENLLRGMINHYTDLPWGNLLPLQASDELFPFPLMRQARSAMMAQSPSLSMTVYTCGASAWCLIYYFSCRTSLLRNDW